MNKQTMLNKHLAQTTKTSFLSAGLLAGIFCISTPTTQAAMSATIQPNAAGNAWVMSVTWDSLDGSGFNNSEGWNLEDSLTGSTLSGPIVKFADPTPEADTPTEIEWNGTASTRVTWNDLGDFMTAGTIADNDAYAAGHGNVSMISGSNFGVYHDHDGSDGVDPLDDFAIIIPGTTETLATSGSFIITGTISPGSFAANYKLGTFTNNPDATITVTDTAFAPVPEPSSTALLGLGGLALILRRRR